MPESFDKIMAGELTRSDQRTSQNLLLWRPMTFDTPCSAAFLKTQRATDFGPPSPPQFTKSILQEGFFAGGF